MNWGIHKEKIYNQYDTRVTFRSKLHYTYNPSNKYRLLNSFTYHSHQIQRPMKVILFSLFLLPFLLFGQSYIYKHGLKQYKKGNFDKALKDFYRAEDNIAKDLKYPLYKLIMEINLIKTNDDVYKRSIEITQAHKYFKKLEKKNKLSKSESTALKQTIIDSSAYYLVQLSGIKRKHRRLQANVKSLQSNELHAFSLLFYLTLQNRNLTTSDFSNFIDGYKRLYESDVSINKHTEAMITKESNKIFHIIARTKYKSLLGNLVGIDAFDNTFLKELGEIVEEKITPYTDTIYIFDWGYNYDIWKLAKSYHELHPSLVDQRMLKSLLINQLFHTRIFEGNEIKKGCFNEGNMCFDETPVTVVINTRKTSEVRTYVINDQLSSRIFKERLRDSYLNNKHSLIRDLIKENPVFIDNHSEEISVILKDWIQSDFSGMIDLFRYQNKFRELEGSHFQALFKQLANEEITNLASEDKKVATDFLLALAGSFPYDSYEIHYDWFIKHFKEGISSKNTKDLGNEMMALNHVFESNSEIIELKRQYVTLDYENSHKTSTLSMEEIQWNGSVNNCDPGTLDQVYYDRMLERIKFFRRWVGVSDEVYFSPENNAKAQAAALIMHARGKLSHHPLSSWKCYSQEGYSGASHGNLYLGAFLSNAIDGYIDDRGQGAAGHRQWILSPKAKVLGTGSIPYNDKKAGSNCLMVITKGNNYDHADLHRDSPILWPPEGSVPYEFIEVLDVWTFTLEQANFDNIIVSVTVNDSLVPVKLYKNNSGSYGSTSYFSFKFGTEEKSKQLDDMGFGTVTTSFPPFEPNDVIKVSVKNVILSNGETKDFDYEVLPFNTDPNKKTYVLSRN